MKLIVKDKHMESIVEKLCHRLRGASDERQCVDLSYCLTLVTYTENIMQKLVDNMACYADKLNFVGVRKNFTTILIACKRQNKTAKVSRNRASSKKYRPVWKRIVFQLTEMIGEFENKIDIILTKGVDNLDANFLKVPKTPAKTPKTPRFRKSSK